LIRIKKKELREEPLHNSTDYSRAGLLIISQDNNSAIHATKSAKLSQE